MKRTILSIAAALAVACGFAGAASAAGVTICNATRGPVFFFLGYVRDGGLESTGSFASAPSQCATLLDDIPAGPFYLYGGVPTGAMAWNADGNDTAQAFCVSRAPHFVIRNRDHIKDGKLACPGGALARFIRIPDAPRGAPKFTFREDNTTDRPPAAAAPAGATAAAKQKTITCPFLANGHVTFDVPAKLGGLPAAIDFDYPAKAKEFSFRDGNLLLLAMDEEEPTRVRILISAELNKNTGTYDGQIFVDMGGHQIMLHNGPVRCTVGPG
jgi:uncharacterized membrane protein